MTAICLSTLEAEYQALSLSMKQLIAFKLLIEDLIQMFELSDLDTGISCTVWEDNQGCLTLAQLLYPQLTPRSKSFAIRYHWFRQYIDKKTIWVKWIETKEQKANIFTKGLQQGPFERERKMLMGW